MPSDKKTFSILRVPLLLLIITTLATVLFLIFFNDFNQDDSDKISSKTMQEYENLIQDE